MDHTVCLQGLTLSICLGKTFDWHCDFLLFPIGYRLVEVNGIWSPTLRKKIALTKGKKAAQHNTQQHYAWVLIIRSSSSYIYIHMLAISAGGTKSDVQTAGRLCDQGRSQTFGQGGGGRQQIERQILVSNLSRKLMIQLILATSKEIKNGVPKLKAKHVFREHNFSGRVRQMPHKTPLGCAPVCDYSRTQKKIA